jgi:ribosomal protein S18 acetylase RimI-like enzyme
MSNQLSSLPGSAVEIIPATWRDLSELRQLEKICFPRDAWPLLDVLSVLSFPGIIRLKATHEDRMVGFIAGEKRNPKKLAWIATFGVLPAYRRMGIGTQLLQACEDALNVARIRLSVRVGNTPALRLYRGFGYQQVGVWPKYYQGNVDAVVLEKHFNR